MNNPERPFITLSDSLMSEATLFLSSGELLVLHIQCVCFPSSQPYITYLHNINRRQSLAPQDPPVSPPHCRSLPSRE